MRRGKYVSEVRQKFEPLNPRKPRSGASYVDSYPTNEFSGLLFCEKCGSRMVTAGSNALYMACGGRRARRCDVHTMAPRAWLKEKLLGAMRDEHTRGPEQVDALFAEISELVRAEAERGDSTLQRLQQEERTVVSALTNLINLAESTATPPATIVERMTALERQLSQIRAQLRAASASASRPPAVPTRAWVVSQIESLEAVLGHASPRELAEIFREFTGGRVTMRAIIPPGRKRRGYYDAIFRGNVISLLMARAPRA